MNLGGGEVGVLEYVVGAVLASLLVRAFVLERMRVKQIRRYAQRAGLIHIGAAVPRSFPLMRTSVHRARSIRNVVAGDRSKRELVFFDCKIGYGKHTRFQTVLGVRGLVEGFGAARFDPSLVVERVDDWTLIYRTRELLTADEIEALVSSV